MKKLLSLLSITSGALLSFAQNDLVVFSEQGERFYVVVDGIKQNAKPETNVKITDIKQPMVTAKIIFDGGKIPDVDQKIYFMWDGEQKNGWEFTYAVVKKGDMYKIKPRSGAPRVLGTVPPPPAGQTVVIYSATPPVESTTVVSTTTTTGAAPAGDNVNVNMNINGVGMGFNVNAPATNTSSTTSTTVVTSTTTSSSGVTASPPPPVYVLPGYNGPYGCPMPMNNPDFESAKSSIKSKSFEDSKLTIAKQILGSNCMLSSQVKEVMLMFSFESTRLDFAKFAYGKTLDPGNYYKLNDAFQFESSIDELNEYIRGQR